MARLARPTIANLLAGRRNFAFRRTIIRIQTVKIVIVMRGGVITIQRFYNL